MNWVRHGGSTTFETKSSYCSSYCYCCVARQGLPCYTAVARLGFKRRASAVLKSNLIRSTEFGTAVTRRLKRALKRLQVCIVMELVHLAYAINFQALQSNRKKWFKYNITGFKTPAGRRQPVGYLQVWPRIWTLDYREQIYQEVRAELEPGTADLRVRRAAYSATLPP